MEQDTVTTDGKKKKLHQVVKSDVNSDNLIQNDRKSERRSYKDAVKRISTRNAKKVVTANLGEP